LNYFYCESYISFNHAVTIHNVSIITPNENIIEACKLLGINFVKSRRFSSIEFLKKKSLVLSETKSISRMIKKNDEFHFSHSQYSIFCFILLNKLVKNNIKCTFHSIELLYEKSKFNLSINYLKSFFYSILLNYKYGNIFQVCNYNNYQYTYRLNFKFFKSLKLIKYDKKELEKKFINFLNKTKLNLPKLVGITFIDQGIDNYSLFDEVEIDKLKKFFYSKNINIKAHPIHKTYFNSIKINFLAEFIPFEMYLKNTTGYVISSYSNSLIFASRFKNIKAISLLYLIKDEKLKIKIKNKLYSESNGNITFAESLENLKDLLK
tara:strand:+ start:901 stop:1863 length:963 start_codon:yes stop_codon:yes gene_type:complete